MNRKDAMRAPITHVLGARPNFMKAAPVIRALAALGHDQRVVHTGQHYDERMSEVFFVQPGLPRPAVTQGGGSGSNRRLTDQLCALLFVTSPEAIGHLAREGRPADAVHLVGNPMIDTLLASMDRFEVAAARAALGLPDRYVVATLHRPSNVDEPTAAAALVLALHEVAAELAVVIPV